MPKKYQSIAENDRKHRVLTTEIKTLTLNMGIGKNEINLIYQFLLKSYDVITILVWEKQKKTQQLCNVLYCYLFLFQNFDINFFFEHSCWNLTRLIWNSSKMIYYKTENTRKMLKWFDSPSLNFCIKFDPQTTRIEFLVSNKNNFKCNLILFIYFLGFWWDLMKKSRNKEINMQIHS